MKQCWKIGFEYAKRKNINTDKITLWISGHTHYSYDFTKNKCRFLSNQMGYSSEINESKFNQNGIFET